MSNPFVKLPLEYRWLPLVEDLEFFAGEPPDYANRGYYYNEIPCPFSITKVVDTRNDYAKRVMEETRHEWEPRGNIAHACLEAHLRGRSYDPWPYNDLVDHLVNFWLWDEWEAIACEYVMFDKRRCIAGTADMILRNKEDHSRIAIADLKTCKTKINKRNISAQLGGYVNLLNLCWYQINVTDCFGVWACPTKTDVEVYDPMDCLVTYEGMRDAFMRKQREF